MLRTQQDLSKLWDDEVAGDLNDRPPHLRPKIAPPNPLTPAVQEMTLPAGADEGGARITYWRLGPNGDWKEVVAKPEV